MKTKLLVVLLAIIVIVIVVYFLAPKSIICTNFILDNEHLINETEIPSLLGKHADTCPNGDKVERIKLIESRGLDAPWREILYCKEDNVFWVADMWGFGLNWYGSFEGNPCLW